MSATTSACPDAPQITAFSNVTPLQSVRFPLPFVCPSVHHVTCPSNPSLKKLEASDMQLCTWQLNQFIRVRDSTTKNIGDFGNGL